RRGRPRCHGAEAGLGLPAGRRRDRGAADRGAGARMTSWPDLDAELDAWAKAGRRAPLWWRDDDAARTTPALERLLALHARHGVPLALAVIPGRAEPSLGGGGAG